MSKKRILIPASSVGENSVGISKTYAHFFSQFGQVEILTSREGIEDGDLLVLTGGQDMNPANYGQVPGFYTGNADVNKEYFYRVNLSQYINAGMPIMGICLGFQALNVFFGGSLTQHYPFPYSDPRNEAKEELEIIKDKEIREMFGQNEHGYPTAKVNSLHHQGVFPADLAPDLIPLAISKVSKNIEALMHKELPIFGVQWHPEELMYSSEKGSNLIVNGIINNLLNQ